MLHKVIYIQRKISVEIILMRLKATTKFKVFFLFKKGIDKTKKIGEKFNMEFFFFFRWGYPKIILTMISYILSQYSFI